MFRQVMVGRQSKGAKVHGYSLERFGRMLGRLKASAWIEEHLEDVTCHLQRGAKVVPHEFTGAVQ